MSTTNKTVDAAELQDAYHYAGTLCGEEETFEAEMKVWTAAREAVGRIRGWGFGLDSTGRGWAGLRAWARRAYAEIDAYSVSLGVDANRGERAVAILADDPGMMRYYPGYASRYGVSVSDVRALLAARLERTANARRIPGYDGTVSGRCRTSWMSQTLRALDQLDYYEKTSGCSNCVDGCRDCEGAS